MNYHNITKNDMLNGDGLRVVLWVAGCSHACKACHNPETWDENGGLLFDDAAKEELFEELAKDYVSGITFSGGDPMYPGNRQMITSLVKECKTRFPEKTVWLYTGYLYEELAAEEVLSYVDVLVDGPFILAQRDVKLHWVGSSNQRVIHLHEAELKG